MKKRVRIEVTQLGENDHDGAIVRLTLDGKELELVRARVSDAKRAAQRLYEAMGKPKGVQVVIPDRKAA